MGVPRQLPDRNAALLLVADSLVRVVADVHEAARVSVPLDVRAIGMLELTAAFDGADTTSLACVLRHVVLHLSVCLGVSQHDTMIP